MQTVVSALSFARFKAGSNSAASIAMMAMTTSNSISVNAPLRSRMSQRAFARPIASILFMANRKAKPARELCRWPVLGVRLWLLSQPKASPFAQTRRRPCPKLRDSAEGITGRGERFPSPRFRMGLMVVVPRPPYGNDMVSLFQRLIATVFDTSKMSSGRLR